MPPRVWGPTTQGRSQGQPHPPATSQAPPPRPPPPPLERAGDLPERLLRDYLSGWTSQFTEYDYYVPDEAVYGTVPEDIRGTLFLIGPGLTEVYGTSVRHPNDADGMVCSLAFGDGGRIFFRNRFVRTASFVAEQALGRRVSRGMHDRGAALLTDQQHQHPPPHHNRRGAPAPPPSTAAAGTRSAASPSSSSSGASGGSSSSSSRRDGWTSGVGAGGVGSAGDRAAKRELERSSSWGGWAETEEVHGGGAGLDRAARHVVAALSAAAGDAGPQQLRLDPLALLGWPPLPPPSSLFNPLDTSFRAPANASVVYWGGRLLAFTEGGSLPYELNKLSLETVGLYDAAGSMADIGRLVGGYKIAQAPPPPQGFASTAPRPARLVLMGVAQSGLDTLVRWVELGEDGRPAGQGQGGGKPTTYRLPGCWAQGVLDFWVTDKHYVVVQAPLDFNPQRFATRATIGAASFAECFDWDPSRPSKIHLVERPSGSVPPPAAQQPVSAASQPGSGAGHRSKDVPKHIVWPTPGPKSMVLEGPPLLPTSCVGCFTPSPGSGVLALDAICQQGLTGSNGGTLDCLDPEDHRHQPKPELTRLLVDLNSQAVTARVLSQRTASAATTAAAPLPVAVTARAASSSPSSSRPPSPATTAAASAAAIPTTAHAAPAAAAPSTLAPVGHGSSFLGGYHHLFAAASATDTATGWAPSQALVKVVLAPEEAAAALAGAASSQRAALSPPSRRRGVGTEVWVPGDRVFVGPPVFVPRQAPAAAAAAAADADGDLSVTVTDNTGTAVGGGELARAINASKKASLLPPLESEVEAAAQRVIAAAAARRLDEEQEGWLLVMVHDASTMTAELCILDARDVTRGPVAGIVLPHHLPHTRAASFTRAYCGPGLAAPPGWRPRVATAAGTGAGAGTATATSAGDRPPAGAR